MQSCASVSVVFESAMNDSLFLSHWSKTITFFIRITTQTSKLLTKQTKKKQQQQQQSAMM
jgi:hypothetical protein